MEEKLEYSFDDEPVAKFCYDLSSKQIQIHFKRYYDLVNDKYIETPCIWVLENWEYGKIKLGDEPKLYDISKSIGIFSLILYMKYNDGKELEMLVNTIDNRYITLFFKDPKLSLK